MSEHNKLLDNFSAHLKNTIARAITIAEQMNHACVEPSHLLLSLSQEKGSIGYEILAKFQIDSDKLIDIFSSKLDFPITPQNLSTDQKTTTLPNLDEKSKEVLEKAMVLSYRESHTYVGTEHLLFGIISIQEPKLQAIFKDLKITKKTLKDQVNFIIQSTSAFPTIDDIHGIMDDIQELNQNGAQGHHLFERPTQKSSSSAINQYSTILTNKDHQKDIDPVIGRDKEIERIISILCRRNKNNPILLGEAGVGKTAIVEGLSKKIAEGSVPDILRNKKVLSLDLTLLIAGTIYRGEFEDRLKQIIQEVSENSNYILFIDEIHNIIGAGSNQGTMDAANILKPALARGKLRCIGATTFDEYEKYIASDPALDRRFQAIHVKEPSAEETKSILNGVKRYYENFHECHIDTDAINAAVDLSIRYVHDNYLPDKAIDLLDEACAYRRSQKKLSKIQRRQWDLLQKEESLEREKERAILKENFKKATEIKNEIEKIKNEMKKLSKQKKLGPKIQISKNDIAYVLSQKTKIDINVLLQSQWENLQRLKKELSKHILGQNQVIENIVETLIQSNLGMKNPEKPQASLLFAGPSGVGKTYLSQLLAEHLYHDRSALIRLNMSEFSESHGVSKLLGSPAGYVGFKGRNHFLEQVKRRPHSILLFDEFDKAHADVRKLLLQILDEGTLTDAQGKKITFKNAIIIITTSVGAQLFETSSIGFDNKELGTKQYSSKIQSETNDKLKEFFGAELLGRIDKICLFHPLDAQTIKGIVEIKLAEINKRLQEKFKSKVKADKQALSAIVHDAYNKHMGARNIDNVLQNILAQTLKFPLDQEKILTLTKKSDHYELI